MYNFLTLKTVRFLALAAILTAVVACLCINFTTGGEIGTATHAFLV